MHLRGQTTTFQTHLEISEHAAAGLNDTQIAERVGCSVWTARKWRRRAQKRGRLGFISHMGRPVTGPVSTFPDTLKEAILHLRQLHPGWGPNTLLTALKMDACWTDQRLPRRAEIARLLKHAGLTRRYQRHHDLLQPPRAEPRTPHQEWQMDAQGIMRVEGVGKVSLITVVDVVSRLKAESYPSLETTNPGLPDYQLTDTACLPHVWVTSSAHARSWHCFLRYYHAFPIPYQITSLVACPWSSSALHTQALPDRPCDH